MTKRTICIDAGHGGQDPGAVGRLAGEIGNEIVKEKDIALAVALLLGQALTRQGFAVCYTRRTDRTIRAAERVSIANRAKAQAFVSIHCNGAANPQASGIETYAYSQRSGGYPLAQAIQASLCQRVKLPDRGVKTINFAVLRQTAMPAALVEIGFLTTPAEARLLIDRQWQQHTAQVIALGIAGYFNI